MLEKLLKKNEIKFIIAFTISVFVFLLLIFALAVMVDPHNDFGTDIFKPLVMTNRTEKLETISNLSPKPDIIIFGSSRVFSMDPELIENITNKKTYNASVSYARPEDHWTMANYIVNDLKIKPELIIVGLNLGELNNDNIEPQTINNKNLIKYLNANPSVKLKNIFRSLKDSINQGYIRDIFVSIFKLNIKPNRTGLQTQDFLPNGQIVSFSSHPEKNQPETDFSKTYSHAFGLFNGLDKLNPTRKLYLENFISFCNQNDIKVKIALLPMPAQTLEKLYIKTNYTNIYQEFLRYTGELHSAYKFDFYDFSTVEKFNGLEYDFDDATHPGVKNIEKITKLIFDPNYAVQ